MKNFFQKFMQGRYGVDSLTNALYVVALLFLLSALFVHGTLKTVLYTIGLFVFLYAYYRVFSKDVQRRYSENTAYLSFVGKIKNKFALAKKHHEQKKDYRFFSCPNCSQKVRVPKNKGKVRIICPKCASSFERTT